MTALVPLNSADALERFHEAGVGEIYVGFHDAAWDERFGSSELNRMSGFGTEANPFSFEEMCGHIARARQLGMQAFVCFNASAYSADQRSFIADRYLPRLAECGASGIILSSQALIEAGRDVGLQVVISTVAGVFNARLAAYYRDCGATRVILPRDLSSDEIAGIVRAVPEVEYEVFLMRNGCMFSDSHCLGCHRKGNPSLCMSLRTGEYITVPLLGNNESFAGGPGGASNMQGANNEQASSSILAGQEQADAWTGQDQPDALTEQSSLDAFAWRAGRTEWLLNTYYHRRTCGLCALWRFEQLGIAAYKVVGRGDDVDDLVADAGLVVRNAALARTCATEAEYLDRMERPREPETLCGYEGLSCYYPELARY